MFKSPIWSSFTGSGIFLGNCFSLLFMFGFAAAFCLVSVKTFGQVGDPHLRAQERLKLAEAWAPTLFQETASEFTNPVTGFNPVDNLVNVFFAADHDVRHNRNSIFELSVKEEQSLLETIPVYFSVVETTSHFYLNYMFYHALDANQAEGHLHDTENIWSVVEKDGSPYGHLVMTITNAHGYGMAYGQDPERERHWREHLRSDLAREILPLIDPSTVLHEQSGRVEYFERSKTHSIKLFAASRTHALYKFNSEAWEAKAKGFNNSAAQKSGVIYTLDTCIECKEAAMVRFSEPIRTFVLADWDVLMEDHLKLRAEEQEKIYAPNNGFFDPAGASANYEARNLPRFLATPHEQRRQSGNLFYTTEFHTPYSLYDPAAMHVFFEGTSEGISQDYVYNFYLNKTPTSRKSLASIITPIETGSISRMMQRLLSWMF